MARICGRTAILLDEEGLTDSGFRVCAKKTQRLSQDGFTVSLKVGSAQRSGRGILCQSSIRWLPENLSYPGGRNFLGACQPLFTRALSPSAVFNFDGGPLA
jgi:hypothetical protein